MKRCVNGLAASGCRWIVLALLGLCAGCGTSDFAMNRRNDARDIFTLQSGRGGGAKVRVGPVNVGMFADLVEVEEAPLTAMPSGDGVAHVELTTTLFSQERCRMGVQDDPLDRNKSFQARGIAGVTVASTCDGRRVARSLVPYYTQVEIALGAVRTIRVGVNPGELLDFLLGFMFVDLFGDDVVGREQEAPEE